MLRPKNLLLAETQQLVDYVEFLEEKLSSIRGYVGLASMLSKEPQVYDAVNNALEQLFFIQDNGWTPHYPQEEYDE